MVFEASVFRSMGVSPMPSRQHGVGMNAGTGGTAVLQAAAPTCDARARRPCYRETRMEHEMLAKARRHRGVSTCGASLPFRVFRFFQCTRYKF